jgi:hypothetical protein
VVVQSGQGEWRVARKSDRQEWLSFVRLESFERDWRHLGLSDDDLRALEMQIIENPTGGPVVPGAGGLRKIRFSPPSWSRGKRGAARVGYYYLIAGGLVFLIVVYAKNEAADLSPQGKQEIQRLIARLRKNAGG